MLGQEEMSMYYTHVLLSKGQRYLKDRLGLVFQRQ